ncbi:hypothetical protein K502DRAFT_332858 [Neoconidiobolus thromboides FSU 785]|nr:hypothetical protein K502DRAFT_332858 [Neoconidiobolus thromboides FSU 785]
MAFYLLFIFYILQVYTGQQVVRLSDASCTIARDKVYYFGGKVVTPNIDVDAYNENVHYLDLSTEVRVSGNIADIKRLEASEESPVMLAPYSFYLGGNSSRVIHFYVYDQGDPMNIVYYDFESKKWSKDGSGKQFLEVIGVDKKRVDYLMIEGFTIVQNDINLNEFIIAGGYYYYLKGDPKITYLPTVIYNENTKKFTKIPIQTNIDSPVNFMYKGDYYYMGGVDKNRKEIGFTKLNKLEFKGKTKLIQKDLRNSNVESIPKKELKLLNIKSNGDIYFFDSYYSDNNRNLIYILNMETNLWQAKRIDNFRTRYGACFVHFKDHLIYSFGYDNKEANGYTYLINTNTWESVGNFSTVTNKLNTTQEVQESGSQVDGSLIGGIIAGVVGGILLGLGIYFIYRRRKKAKGSPPPFIAEPPSFSFANKMDDEEINFRLSTLSEHFNENELSKSKREYLIKNGWGKKSTVQSGDTLTIS